MSDHDIPPRPAGRTPTAMPDPAPGPGPNRGTEAEHRATFAFVALMAALGAINAFSTDIVIPALGLIDDHFALPDPNQRQWVLLVQFVGVAISQLMIGPVADSLGRRRTAAINFCTFLAGCVLCVLAPDFHTLLLGRLLQGLGSGGLRVISLAVTRDLYKGDAMARIVSLSSAVFILIILLAPALGQGIVAALDWRWVFGVLLLQAAATAAWFFRAQTETLSPDHRRPLSFAGIVETFGAVFANRWCMAHAAALSLAFGAFVAYLATAQQVFADIYGLGDWLPAVFGALSALNGASAMLSARLVRRIGARKVAGVALIATAAAGALGAVLSEALWSGVPPLWALMVLLAIPVGAFAAMYGNLSAVALIPMGARAGAASAVVSAMGSGAGVVYAGLAGASFDGTTTPLMTGFAISGALGWLIATRLAGEQPT